MMGRAPFDQKELPGLCSFCSHHFEQCNEWGEKVSSLCRILDMFTKECARKEFSDPAFKQVGIDESETGPIENINESGGDCVWCENNHVCAQFHQGTLYLLLVDTINVLRKALISKTLTRAQAVQRRIELDSRLIKESHLPEIQANNYDSGPVEMLCRTNSILVNRRVMAAYDAMERVIVVSEV